MMQKRDLAVWEKIVLILVYFLFVQGIVYITMPLLNVLQIGISSNILGPLLSLVVFAIIFLIIKLAERKPFRHYGFRGFSGKQAMLMVAFVFLLMPLALLGRLVDPGYDAWYANATGLMTMGGLLFFTLIMPLFVIKEEIIERALFQNRIRTYGFWWMLIAVAVNFAFAHFFIPGSGLIHVVVWAASVLVGSVALIVFFEISGNMWLSMLLHLLFNVAIGLQIYLHVVYPKTEIAFWIAMMVGAAIAYIFAWKDFAKPFRHERFQRISSADIAFIVIFAVILPLALIFL